MLKYFCVYGDNIVECARMIRLISDATSPRAISISGNPTAPTYKFDLTNETFCVSIYPGFERWQNNIIRNLRANGGVLREAPDIILTSLNTDSETPILAIEFCSALPAGNNAWQRSGRAYSTVKAGIPYIYLTEIGGYELGTNRKKKATRLPNPAIPFSYFSYSAITNSQITIAYQMNPGADDISKAHYEKSVCGHDLLAYLKSYLLGGDRNACFKRLQQHLLNFVYTLSENQRGEHLSASDWEDIANNLSTTKTSDAVIKKSTLRWRKKIIIPTTTTFRRMFAIGRNLCLGAVSCDLPVSILPRIKIRLFYNELKHVYGKSAELLSPLLALKTDVAICWYAGFKPRGDDGRPDRGVLPLARMLLGDEMPIITFIYGPASPSMLELLEKHPDRLRKGNGLWEATLSLSDFVICDAKTGRHPVLLTGMMNEIRSRSNNERIAMPANTKHFPEDDYIGENDVDSIIHTIFTAILKKDCFEMMCNPPGGDWSGISLKSGNNEYRWLTLPRVSAQNLKRPDHVIQIGADTIFSIESKDFYRNLEKNIGPRLNGYCEELFKSPPSCVRSASSTEWTDKTDSFKLPKLKYVSAAAFLISKESDMDHALASANTDVVLGIEFRRSNYAAIVSVMMSPHTDETVKKALERLCSLSKREPSTGLQLEFELH